MYTKYSVLMSVYKGENPEFLQLSLDSMLNQTIKPDEIVLVIDGPLTDELYQTIDEYRPYLHLVVNDSNLGLGLSLNRGLNECRNELVARMDTDDISRTDRCELQLKRFNEKPYLSIVGSHVLEFSDSIDNIISERRVPLENESIYRFGKRRSAFNHPSVMYKKSAVLSEGGYSSFRRNQDVDLFGRMMFHGHYAENIDEALLWFRTGNQLAKRRKTWENTYSYIQTIYRFWKLGYSSFLDLIIVSIAQLTMFIMPIKIQLLIYKVFLRS